MSAASVQQLRARATPAVRNRGPAILIAAAAVSSAGNFAFHATASRMLGPGAYSTVAALLAMLVVVAVPIGAVQTAVTQASANSSGASAVPTMGRSAYVGAAILAVGVALAAPLNSLLHLHDPTAVALASAWAAVACVGAVAKGSLLGRLRYGPVAGALLAGASVRLALGAVLIPWFGVDGAMLATVAGETCAALIAVSAMRGDLLELRGDALRPRGTDATIALAAQLGLWTLVGITTMVGRRVLPAEQAGDFAAASTIASAATFLPFTAAVAFLPHFARDGSRAPLRRALTLSAVLGGGAAAALVVAPQRAVHLLAGRSFDADPLVVAPLAIGCALVGCTGVAVFFLIARRRAAALAVWPGAAGVALGAFVAHDARALALVGLCAAAIAATTTITAALRVAAEAHDEEVEVALPPQEVDLSVVVPTFNGGDRLRPAVEAVVATLQRTGWTYEVIVAVDGSTDGSERTLAALPREVAVTFAAVNEGKGAALNRGFRLARGRLVGFVDGDGDIDPSVLIPLAAECTRPGVWAAIASKHRAGAEVHMSAPRAVLSRGYRLLVRLLFGLDVSDTQCGAKVFERDALGTTLAWSRERGFAFDVELLALGHRFALGEIAEVPVRLSRTGGRSTVSATAVLRTLRETLRVWGRVLDTPVVVTAPDTGISVSLPARPALEVACAS